MTPIARSEEDTIHRLAEVACPYLTPDELEDVRNLGEQVPAMLRRMAGMLEGVGCMAITDDDDERGGGGTASGSFQTGDSLGDLLFTVASFARMTTGLLYAAGSAESYARNPEYRHPRALGGGWLDEVNPDVTQMPKPLDKATAPG